MFERLKLKKRIKQTVYQKEFDIAYGQEYKKKTIDVLSLLNKRVEEYEKGFEDIKKGNMDKKSKYDTKKNIDKEIDKLKRAISANEQLIKSIDNIIVRENINLKELKDKLNFASIWKYKRN